MQITYHRTTTIRTGGRVARLIPWVVLLLGVALLVGAGFAAWSEIRFRGVAVEADARIVEMRRNTSRDRDGNRSETWTPVFAFRGPDGQEVRVRSSVSSNPPCCRVGDVVRVRYDPARPERATMTGFMDTWFPTVLLGGMGAVFLLFGGIAARVFRKGGAALQAAQAAASAPSYAVPLAGLRREQSGSGPVWILQARWTDPRSGVGARLFESPPLPFDPVPQMRQMTTVQVQFDPSVPDGPYWMDLSFLHDPRAGA